MVEEERVASVLAFFERYEERVASLDKRTMEVQQDIKKMEEKIKVLRSNAEKINPEAKVVSKETIRSVAHDSRLTCMFHFSCLWAKLSNLRPDYKKIHN